jgi:CRISPR-associated protein Cas6
MLWDEETKPEYTVSDDVVDLFYKINCKQIPTTHAFELAEALYAALPWLKDEPNVGIHQIHGATSGNGWERPPDGELIHLSKRSKMSLRVPKHRIDDAMKLSGQTLDIAGCSVEVGSAISKMMHPLPTIFARYIVVPEGMDESQFIQWVSDELAKRDIQIHKLLCGITHELKLPEGMHETRSVMIADLDQETSVNLQENGLGPFRHYGCGIFMPQKGIRAVGETEDKSHFSGT